MTQHLQVGAKRLADLLRTEVARAEDIRAARAHGADAEDAAEVIIDVGGKRFAVVVLGSAVDTMLDAAAASCRERTRELGMAILEEA